MKKQKHSTNLLNGDHYVTVSSISITPKVIRKDGEEYHDYSQGSVNVKYWHHGEYSITNGYENRSYTFEEFNTAFHSYFIISNTGN